MTRESHDVIILSHGRNFLIQKFGFSKIISSKVYKLSILEIYN